MTQSIRIYDHLRVSSIGLCHWDEFSMVSALVCTVTHWIGPTMSHDIRILGSHDFIKFLYYIVFQPWENIELVNKLIVAYGWDHKLVIIPYGLGYYLWKSVATSIPNRGTMISHGLWDSVSP